MTTDNQTLPNNFITSTWGQQVNDGIIQVFATFSNLPAAGATPWAPAQGSLAFTTAEKGLWRFTGTAWESALARGFLVNGGNTAGSGPNNFVLPNNGSYAVVAALPIPGGVRQGCTYLLMWSCNPLTASGNISLWGGQALITVPGVNPPLGDGEGAASLAPFGPYKIHKAGGGWPGGAFSSVNQSGTAVVGPMPRSLASAEARWIAGTNNGSPAVTLNETFLNVVEVGGPY